MVTTCGFCLLPYSFPLPPASTASRLPPPLLPREPVLRPPFLPAWLPLPPAPPPPAPGCLPKRFSLPLDIMDSDQICASATLRKDFWDALGLEGQYFSQYS